MADAPQKDAPEGMETKDAMVVTGGGRDSVLGYRSAPVPHETRTGTQLTEEELAATHAVSGSPAHGDGVVNQEVGGITTASGGTEVKPVVGKSTRAK